MIKKGVYPYDFIDDFSKLYASYLQKNNDFDSKLNKSKCSKEGFDQAESIGNKFYCKNLLDYHNIY